MNHKKNNDPAQEAAERICSVEKVKKFIQDAINKATRDLERQLTDARNVCRETRGYLIKSYPSIRTMQAVYEAIY